MSSRIQLSRGDVVLIAVAGLIGGVVGGWLDYNTLSDNDYVRALAVRLLAIVVALVAGAVWALRRGQRAKVAALAAVAFLVASQVGGWIAPSAHPVGWSSGSAHVVLGGALSRTETVAVDCTSMLDGSMIGVASVMRDPVAPDRLGVGLTIQAESPLSGGPVPASTALYLQVWTGLPGSGLDFDYNPEARITTFSAEGTGQRGQLTFERLPRLVNGDPSLPNDLPTLFGTIDWTCQPAAKEPTPIEGSWFH